MTEGGDESSVYDQLGAEGFTRLVAAFYRRVAQDDLIGPLYPADDLPGSEERLRGFLVMRFGGPDDYLRVRGHPRLRMRHMPFDIDQKARDRWMELMTAALAEAEIPEPSRTTLFKFFDSSATFLINSSPA